MKCFSVDVCIYGSCAFLINCHDSTSAFLIVVLILMYALYSTCAYLSVCAKCFSIDVGI